MSPKKETPPPAPEVSFEEAVARLESIVGQLEEGDLPLERSLELFEEGVRLSRSCVERLEKAERRIEMLLQDEATGAERVAPFEPSGEG